jgi:hypothetical protein
MKSLFSRSSGQKGEEKHFAVTEIPETKSYRRSTFSRKVSPPDSETIGPPTETLSPTRGFLSRKSLKPLALDFSKVEKADPSKWSSALLYSTKSIKEQVKNGNKVISSLDTIFNKYAKLHRQLGEELAKTVDKELIKLSEESDRDKLCSLYASVLQMCNEMRNLSKVHVNHAKFVEVHVVDGFKSLDTQRTSSFKSVSIGLKKALEAIEQKDKAVSKKKKQCQKLLEDLQKSGDSSSSKLFDFSSKAPDHVIQAYKSCEEYEAQIEETNAFVNKYSSVDRVRSLNL